MRNITTIWLLLAALANGSCQNSDTTTFAVNGEIMGACSDDETTAVAPTIKPAPNITVGTKSVYAFYENAEFILNYSGQVFIEKDGKQNEPIPAKVFQLEEGVWLAEIAGGQYIKVFTKTGTTNVDLDGEFRTYAKN